jgi:hypothetical protein
MEPHKVRSMSKLTGISLRWVLKRFCLLGNTLDELTPWPAEKLEDLLSPAMQWASRTHCSAGRASVSNNGALADCRLPSFNALRTEYRAIFDQASSLAIDEFAATYRLAAPGQPASVRETLLLRLP